MSFYQFQKEQLVPVDKRELWTFISNPRNLELITPSEMSFRIKSEELPNRIYQGMIIEYGVRLLWNIEARWVTEITHLKEEYYFVDEQRIGPYRMWHHQHILVETKKGCLMKDIISYQPPFGLIGRVANELVIRKTLEQIFNYRKERLDQIFCS